MKLTAVLLLCACLTAGAKGFSQKVTLSEKDAPLQQVFKKIRQQTGYDFLYSSELLLVAGKVSVQLSNVPLETALVSCLKDKPLSYRIFDRTVVISEKTVEVITPAIVQLAEPREIRGIVKDEKQNPLPGITVFSRKARLIVVTGTDGSFYFNSLPEGDTLQFSSVNYQQVVVPVRSGGYLNVFMRPRVAALEAITIVNTGYQTLQKEKATGSFSKPDMKVYAERTSSMDVIARLEGMVPGMQLAVGGNVTSANTNGNGVTTRKSVIRGIGSVRLVADPLYVVNGVVVQEFSAINPDDIEDITVLKDAAASSIWGARSANGVIVITTKSGNRAQRLSVNYTGFVNFAGKPDFDYARMMNSEQYIQTFREIFDATAYPLGSLTYSTINPHEQILYDQVAGKITTAEASRKLDSLASINNSGQIQDLFYRPVITTNHTVSASGGNNIYSFYASAGYTGSQSANWGEKNNSYKLNLTQTINAGSRLKLTVMASLLNRVTSKENMPQVTNTFLPYQLFVDENGQSQNMGYLYGVSEALRNDYATRSRINLDYYPMDEIHLAHGKSNNINVYLNTNLSLKIWKGLSFNGTYGYQKSPGTVSSYTDAKTFSLRKQIVILTVAPTASSTPKYYFPIDGGTYQTGNNDQRNWTVRNQLVYEANLRNNKDHLLLQAGNDVQENFSSRGQTTLFGYNEALANYAILDYAMLRTGFSGTVTGYGSLYSDPYQYDQTTTRFLSYFALASYNINRKYRLDASLRQDHSNNFGTDLAKRKRVIWSFGGKWQLSQERFMQTIKWIDNLGVRATYGITGNAPGSGAATLNDVVYAQSLSNNSGAIAGNAFTMNSVANRSVSWENTANYNLGVDFSVLKRRLSGSIDVYKRITTDMLGSIPLNPFTGSTSIVGNLGKLVNQGIEVGLQSLNVATKNFSWSSHLTFSYNKNKLVEYSPPASYTLNASSRINGGAIIGYSMNSLWAYRFAGLDNMGDPMIYLTDKTTSKNPSTAKLEDVAYMGTTLPVFHGGLSNTLTYRGISLGLNTVYYIGAVMRRDVNNFYTGRMGNTTSFSGSNFPYYVMDRWRQPGDEAFTNIPSYVANSSTSYSRRNTGYYTQGDINVIKADYFKLRDVTLGYDLPAGANRFLRMQRVHVYAQATNFLLWTANNDGIDPEFTDYNYPGRGTPPRHGYSLGLNLSF